MGDVELVDARQHPPGAANPQVGAPDRRPAAFEDDTAGDGFGLLEAFEAHFIAEHGFQAGHGGEENVEVFAGGHRGG